MKFLPILLAGLSAAAPSRPGLLQRRQDASTRTLILGAPGQIIAAQFNGAEFSVVAKDEQEGTGPSWMLFRNPELFYAVNENSDKLRLFSFNAQANELKQVVELESSAGVVHLEFNQDQTRMVGSAYGNGTIDVWDTSAEDGTPTLIKTLKSGGELAPASSEPTPIKPSLTPRAVSSSSTTSAPIASSSSTPKTTHTRSPITSSSREAATHYTVVCERTNQLLTYSLTYSDDSIDFSNVRPTSTFGDAFPKNATTAAAGEVVLSANGRDLYVSNRLTGNDTDSISHFRASASGCLTFKGQVSSGGVLPRMISLSADSSQGTLFAANQKGDNGLVAFRRDSSGILISVPVAAAELSAFAEAGSDLGPQFVLEVPAAASS
ncbi:unnamed protein product [Parascedosporium putredinis]|uniref:Uncharacterized protein n=1 Tax=Parascedosporium putredinis TaxID=1442378 RepID=A0A9P1MCL1_9PEZI|nr:unnamed protein product [Parascedosporium putredinis]CAI8000900.1 unnamed protein product [Parascedosporium putredinis]